jgi:hypothetical protein
MDPFFSKQIHVCNFHPLFFGHLLVKICTKINHCSHLWNNLIATNWSINIEHMPKKPYNGHQVVIWNVTHALNTIWWPPSGLLRCNSHLKQHLVPSGFLTFKSCLWNHLVATCGLLTSNSNLKRYLVAAKWSFNI